MMHSPTIQEQYNVMPLVLGYLLGMAPQKINIGCCKLRLVCMTVVTITLMRVKQFLQISDHNANVCRKCSI